MPKEQLQNLIQPRHHSIDAGDLVLAVVPPFFNHNWLGAGIVRIAHILTGNGFAPRVPRLFEKQGSFPKSVVDASLQTLALDIQLSRRLETIQKIAAQEADFFNVILSGLLHGNEDLFAFSVWRTNIDVTLEVCRQLKQRRPEAVIILGGPEAIERGDELRGPLIDAIVSGSGEEVIVPLVDAFLNGQGGRARRLSNTWVSERHPDDEKPLRGFREVSELGPVDYRNLMPLVMEDTSPELPTVLNVGCVYNCGFCTNRLVYPKMTWGQIEACVEEVSSLGNLWLEAWPDPESRPGFTVQFCDAAINGKPKQFLELSQALADAPRPWDDGAGKFGQSANWVVDHRVDHRLTETAIEGGFTFLFFGLESANDRIRKVMRKPGSKAQVWKGLVAANEASQGRLNVSFGTIVGWPSETESEHYETLDFMEKIVDLQGLSPSCNVSPLFRAEGAQDGRLMKSLGGADYGLLWKGEGESGSPIVRARRAMSYAERFRGIMRIDYPVPLESLTRWMMPEESYAFLDRWFEQINARTNSDTSNSTLATADHDDSHEILVENRPQLLVETDESSRETEANPSQSIPMKSKVFDEQKIKALFSVGKIRQDRIQVSIDEHKAEVFILRASGDPLLTFVVYPRKDGEKRDCYFKTRNLDISLRGAEHGPDQLAVARRLLPFVEQRDGKVELDWYDREPNMSPLESHAK